MRFYEGERVVIREWDDMVEEFGLSDDLDGFDEERYILCEMNFLWRMKEFCGAKATIIEYRSHNDLMLSFDDPVLDTKKFEWNFSDDMLKPDNDSSPDIFSVEIEDVSKLISYLL